MSEQASAPLGTLHQEAAAALHRSVTALLEVLALGPTGRDKQRLGRGCVCWGCGNPSPTPDPNPNPDPDPNPNPNPNPSPKPSTDPTPQP